MKLPDILQNCENESNQSDLKDGVDYHFTEEEIKSLAKFIRRNQDSLPDELSSFRNLVESRIYNSMSIQEVKRFYSQLQ